MNSFSVPDKNRLLAVFRQEIPDRVPNFEVLVENPTLHHILGRDIPSGNTIFNIDPLDYIEFVEKIGQDAIGMCFYGHPFHYRDENGEVRRVDFQIKSKSDLDKMLTTSCDWIEDKFRLLKKYEKAVQDTKIGLFVLMGSFFCDTYTSLFGFNNFMYMLEDDRCLVEEVLERYASYCVQMVTRLMEYDLTFLYFGDDIAFRNGTLINPDLMRQIWIPRLKRVLEPAVKKSMPILFHSDGDISCLLPDIIDLGVNAINPIEPYGMDIREIKKQYGRHLSFFGNLDVGGALSCGTVDEVRRESRELIDEVGNDGGLVIASSHSITSNVKPENFLAMVHTAQTYGRY
jgi:uroporphyrinogen-III decarboxylase